MKITRKAIPYIYLAHLGAGMLFITSFLLTGCAGSGGTRAQSGEQTTADDGQKQACKSAIDDVTRYCSGDDASTGKCNDAKVRTRQLCIDSN